MMTSLTVIVTPRSSCHLVTALRDLSALGLVTPFCWTASDEGGLTAGDVQCVETGAARPSRLDQEIAVHDPDRVRVVVLSEWDRPAEAAAALDAAESLMDHQALPAQRTQIVLAPPGGSDTSPVGRAGWFNVVLSPEDGYRPSASHAAWREGLAHGPAGRRAAHAVAALSGLLLDHEDTWLDTLRPPVGTMFRVARVYYRRLDGRAVEHTIQERLFDLSEQLPRVWSERQQGDHFAVPSEATSAMAGRWWAVARQDLVSARSALPRTQVAKIGFLQALTHFLGFVLASIRNAPGAWARALVRGAEQRLTDAVDGYVFGERSAYRVILRRGGDDPPDPDELARALRTLDDSLPGRGDAGPGQGHAWKALVEGALILGDSGGGAGPMAFSDRGQVATVDSIDHIAAPPDSRYQTEAASLRPHLSSTVVEAGDYLGTRTLHAELDRLAKDPSVGSDAAVESDRLKSWWQVQRRSYTAETSRLLGDAHLSAMREITELGARLQTDGDRLAREAEQVAAGQKRSRRRVLLWLALGLLVAAASVALGVMELISVTLATTLAIGGVLTGLVGAFVTFYRQQRSLFQLLHRLDEGAQLAPVLEQNLAAAVRDARRTIDAYEVHRWWARVLRLFLEDPFGAGSMRSAEPPHIVGEMPLSAAIGEGTADDVQLAKEVRRLQQRHFPTGWMHRAWQQHLDALPAHLGVAGVHLSSGTDILSQRGPDALASLRQVVRTVSEEGSPSGVGDTAWAAALRDLQEGSRQQELMPELTLLGSTTVLTRQKFDQQFEAEGEPRPFRTSLFDAEAITGNLTVPQGVWQVEKEQGLSRSRLLVAYSEEMAPERLVRYVPGGRDHDHAPDPEPDPSNPTDSPEDDDDPIF